jgi:hypothetical protein
MSALRLPPPCPIDIAGGRFGRNCRWCEIHRPL